MAGERFSEVKGVCDYFCDRYPDQEDGPAHTVISDYNFESDFINATLVKLDAEIKAKMDSPAYRDGLIEARWLMRWILAIPEAERIAPDVEVA